MKKIMSGARAGRLLLILFAFMCAMLISAQAFSAGNPIASLTSFKGTVLIKSQGNWGVEPEEGLSLYSDDKVVTKIGTAIITFNDGAVIEVKANSNLSINQGEEKGESLVQKAGGVTRQLRLLLGKMTFRTSRGSDVKTTLATTTMVCGLRGTAGTISIGADGQTYLQFTEGSGETVGDFISGIATEVPSELANLNPAQRAAFVATAAADQAKQASEKLASGEITDADAAYAAAQAAEAAAQEAKTAAEAMLSNPDPAVQTEAAAAIVAADAAVAAAQATQQQAIDSGATPGAAPTGEVSEVGFEAEVADYSKGDLLEDNDRRMADVYPPVITVSLYPATITNLNGASFEFTAMDNISKDPDIVVSYKIDGGEPITLDPPTVEELAELGGEPYFYTVDFSDLSESQHQIIITATDEEHNTSTESYIWTTDYTAPIALIPTTPADIANTSSFGFDATDTNKALGITYQYSLDGGAWTSTPSTLNLGLATDGSVDGSRMISIKATDAAGNTGSAVSYTWTYDTIAPVASIPTTPADIANTSSFGFSATDTNASAGITYQYSLDGGAWTTTATTLDLALAAGGSQDGSHTIGITATDVAGNTSTTISYTWTYDTVAPTVALSASPDSAGATITANNTNYEPGTASYNYGAPNTGLGDGPYTFNIIATDQAGNSSEIQTVTFSLTVADLTGIDNIIGTGSDIWGSATGTLVSVDGETVTGGGWQTNMTGNWEGTHTGDLSLVYGGTDEMMMRYWLSNVTGSISTDTGEAEGDSDFTLITPFALSEGDGTFTGNFTGTGSGTWTGTETGSQLIDKPLAFVSSLYTPIMEVETIHHEGRFNYTLGSGYYTYEYSDNNTDGHSYYYNGNYVIDYNDGAYDWKLYYIELYYNSDGTYYGYGYGYRVSDNYWSSVYPSGDWTEGGTYSSLAEVLPFPPDEWDTNYIETYARAIADPGISADAWGLIGGTDSLWGGGDVDVIAVGNTEYFESGPGSIWFSPIASENYSVSGEIVTESIGLIPSSYTTYDGGAYFSYIGGIAKEQDYGEYLEGMWVGLGIDSAGNVGYIRDVKSGDINGLTGKVYPNEMFKMQGLVNWDPKTTVPGVTAGNFYISVGEGILAAGPSMGEGGSIYFGYGGMLLGGTLGTGETSGQIYGISSDEEIARFQTASIIDQQWGIYGSSLFGTYDGTGTTWSSHVGGEGEFGYVDTTENTNTYGWRYYSGGDYGSYYYSYDDSADYGYISYYSYSNGYGQLDYQNYYIYFYPDGTYHGYNNYTGEEFSGTWNPTSEFLASLSTPPAEWGGSYSSDGPYTNGPYISGFWNDGYYLGTTSSSWADGILRATFNGAVYTDLGIGNINGGILGTYNEETKTWEAVNLGTWEITIPFDYGYGGWGGSNSLRYDNNGYNNSAASMYGIVGLIEDSTNFDLYAMGEWGKSGGGNPPYIWTTQFDTRDVVDVIAGGYGGYGGIEGYSGGIWRVTDDSEPVEGKMDGDAYAILMKSDGTTALLGGAIDGDFYEMGYDGSGMWIAGGSLAAEYKTTPDAYDPTNAWIDRDWSIEAYLSGDFGIESYIYGGSNDGSTMFITYYDPTNIGYGGGYSSLPWGLYTLKLGNGNNYYYNPSNVTSWSGMIGGYGGFGIDDTFGYGGYWLASAGGTWTTGGETEGNLSGTYITREHMGTIGGPFYGLYTEGETVGEGTWVGASVGAWEGQPTALGGYIYGIETYNYYDEMWGILGGLQSPGATGATFNAIGEITDYSGGWNMASSWYGYGGGDGSLPDIEYVEGEPGSWQIKGYSDGYWFAPLYGNVTVNETTGAIGITGNIDPEGYYGWDHPWYTFYLTLNGYGSFSTTNDPFMGQIYEDIYMWSGTGMELVPDLEDYEPFWMSGKFIGEIFDWYDYDSYIIKGIMGSSYPGELIMAGIHNQYYYSSYYESEAFMGYGGGVFTDTYNILSDDSSKFYWMVDAYSGEVYYDSWIGASLEGIIMSDQEAYYLGGGFGGDVMFDIGFWMADGEFMIIEPVTLAMGNYFNASTYRYGDGALKPTGSSLSGVWSAVPYGPGIMQTMSIGEFDPVAGYFEDPVLFLTGIEGYTRYVVGMPESPSAYYGYMNGLIGYGGYGGFYYGTIPYMNVSSPLAGLFVDESGGPDYPAGIVFGGSFGEGYPDLGMFYTEGYFNSAVLTEGITVSPGHLFDTGNIIETTFPITGSGSSVSTDLGVEIDTGWVTIASIIGEDWGIWNSMISGTAESQEAPDWLIEFSNETGTYFGVQNIEAFPDGPEELDAVHGAWADLSTVMPATGIMSGALTGTFDPNSMFPLPNRWMAAGAGAWIETNKLLEMAAVGNTSGNAALDALNIPYIEVGRTDLTGSGGNLTEVNMNDVIFFAYSTGDPAKIWAAGDVNGTFTSGSNPLGDTAILNGSGTGASFSDVNFTVNNWAGGTWGATVDGSGTVGTVTPYNVNINGVAAGTVDSATEFSGTSAGIAAPQEALVVVP